VQVPEAKVNENNKEGASRAPDYHVQHPCRCTKSGTMETPVYKNALLEKKNCQIKAPL